ncbi:endonuclease Q family protein [Rhizobium phaseoli]|uniref:endonuclease Q family protein n=1 Tax=Rhizobium phaseoli TaxID=396 RepID=UPI001FED5B32|nr:endonuclease Q family protein [Rhizobium phaseoli]
MTNSEIINTSTRAAIGPIQPGSRRYTGCPNCGKALSIAEVIERHCENCGRQTSPKDMRQMTNPDSLTPP